LFLKAVLWWGAPWRDLPAAFSPWNSVFQRFRRWAKKGVFKRLFEVLSDDPDFEYAMVRSSRFTGMEPAQKGDSQSGHRAAD